MAKTLLEIYRALTSEATNVFRAQAAGLGAAPAAPRPVDAKAQGIGPRPAASPSTSGTSTAFGGRPTPTNAINNLGRVSQKPEARPSQQSGSKPIVDLSKPGIGAGSQGDNGRMNTPVKSIAQAVSDTSSYSAQAQINKPKLNTSQAAQKPTTNIKTPMMDKAVADKTATDNAARVAAVRRPAPAPVRPGERVPGEKVATNAELTAQARRLGAKNVPQNTNMQNSPLNQTRGAGTPTLMQRVNKAINGVADYINKKSGDVDQSIGNPMGDVNPAQDNSVPTQTAGQNLPSKTPVKPVTSTGNPNAAGGARTPVKPVTSTGNPNAAGGARTPVKPVQPVQKKVNKQPVQNKLKPVRKQPSTGAVKTKPVKKGPRLQSRYQRDSLAGPGN